MDSRPVGGHFPLWQSVALGAGILAPFLYTATVAVGAAFQPGYSHIANAISELLEAGRGAALEPFMLLYNLLIVTFALGVAASLARRDLLFRIGATLLGLGGVLGVAMTPFPMDPIGSSATAAGITHIVIAGMMSITSMVCLLCFALAWRRQVDGGVRSIYAFLSLAIVFVSGGIAAVSAAGRWPLMGLFERLTIGTYLAWIMVLAIDLLRPIVRNVGRTR